MSASEDKIFEFSDFRLDVRERILSHGGNRLQVTDKAFDLLCVLVERGGSLVTKDELFAEVWRDAIVEENTLDKNISLLRRILKERGRETKFIETVRGHGYRFVADVISVRPGLPDENASSAISLATVRPSAAHPNINSPQAASVVAISEWLHHSQEPASIPDSDENAEALPDAAAGEGRKFGRKFLFGAVLLGVVGLTILSYAIFWNRATNSESSNTPRKIAVLPLINQTQDPDTEYLSDGITEGIIDGLAQISGVKVMSRNSVFHFKSDQMDLKGIASQLGVDSVMTGEIKKVEDRFIISVRLVNAADGIQVWGRQYLKSQDDLLTAQEEIASDIAVNLRIKLDDPNLGIMSKGYTRNAAAYQFYLLGRYHGAKLTEPEILLAIDFFQKATASDPSFALAYAGLADAYRPLAIAGWHMSSREALERSKAAALRALQIDPELASARSSLAWTLYMYDHDWNAAESEFRKALLLSPFDADIHRGLAHMLSFTGRHEEAIVEGKKAAELDPLSLSTGTLYAQFLFFGGQTEAALAQIQKTFEIEPDFWLTHNLLGRIYVAQGNYSEALEEFKTARDHSGGGSIVPMTEIGYTYAKMGDREAAMRTLDELRKARDQRFVPYYSYAMIYNGLGERDMATKYLERSIRDGEADAFFIKDIGRWDSYMADPHFIEILRPLNFQPQ